jgi:hypothetical protein
MESVSITIHCSNFTNVQKSLQWKREKSELKNKKERVTSWLSKVAIIRLPFSDMDFWYNWKELKSQLDNKVILYFKILIVHTPPRLSEISMKNWRATVKPVLTPHLWYKAMVKKILGAI